MARKIKFFCTRCRHLVQFPADKIGSVVPCPDCNQALIIPDITDLKWEQNDSSSDNLRAPESINSNVLENTLTEKVLSEKIESNSWNSPPPLPGIIPDNDSFTSLPPVINNNDNQLEDGSDDINAPPVINIPEYYFDENRPKRKSSFVSFIKFMTLLLIIAVIIFFVNNFLVHDVKNSSADTDKPPVEQKVTILIDGRITNIGDNDKQQEEAGSFIFMFPENFGKASPLTTTGLTINNTHPIDIKNFKEKIASRGGLFMISDSSGTFDGKLSRGGKYRILIVSSKVLQKKGEDHTAEFQQIGKYLFNPSDPLLRDYSFIWVEKNIEENHFLLEHNFGRVSGDIFKN